MQTVVIIIDNIGSQRKVRTSGMLEILKTIGVSSRLLIISDPDKLKDHCSNLLASGTKVFICVASASTTLPEAIAAFTNNQRPILGVALSSDTLDYQFALSSMICMPSGVPISFCGSDTPGLVNATLLACQILALSNETITAKLNEWLIKNTRPTKKE